MDFQINGTTLQSLDIELKEGESVFTESGGMAWMSANIDMDTSIKGGLGAGLGRMVSGESLFLVTYTCNSGTGLVTFCNELPGKIVKFNMSERAEVICQKDAFMVAEDSVKLKTRFRRRLGAGFFGGEGFFLQEISGEGMAFLEFSGEITEMELAEGQVLKVDPGHIGAFEPSVDFDINKVRGIKNMFFGGEGFFLATLRGPGKVWLQSMPLANLARKLAFQK
jgi:uncharacterized protein (TIGR00266 family)